MSVTTRDTISIEEATVVRHEAYPAQQFILRLHSPEIAAAAGPGSFVHLRCGDDLPMRRPMSIMRVDPEAGCYDVLFKVVGTGTAALAAQQVGAKLSVMGPIGRCFEADADRPKALLLGGGVGIPPMLYLADAMQQAGTSPALVVMGSEVPFPFANSLSSLKLNGLDIANARSVPELEAKGITSRLASAAGIPGSFDGYITDLARAWLQTMSANERDQIAVYACGPNPMLHATAILAEEFELPCQVSLEEFMACAVGGCAGCTVLTRTNDGPAMRRVCVDGPVFDATTIDWQALAH